MAVLAAYCVAHARWSEAEKALRTYGVMVKDADGLPTQSPIRERVWPKLIQQCLGRGSCCS